MKNTVAKEILKIEKDKLMAEPDSNRDWELITALEIAIEALDNAPTVNEEKTHIIVGMTNDVIKTIPYTE